MKVCIIHIYIGDLPPWFNLFLQSCEYNKHLDFLLLTDNKDFSSEVKNIVVKYFTKTEFEKLATITLGFPIILSDSYKLCDFKPAFGKIFSGFLEEYDFWAYCDNDLLFGDLNSFISFQELNSFDILSTYTNFMSGPLCFYRNTDRINNLFTNITNYKKVLQNTKWCAIEENFLGVLSIKDIYQRFFRKLDFYIYNHLKKGDTPQAKVNNFWIHKRKRMNSKSPKDISEVVWRDQKIGGIRVLFKGLMKSDREYERLEQSNWKIFWKEGKLYSKTYENEIFAFHFLGSKSEPEFRSSFWQIKDKSILTKLGLK